MAGRAAGGRRKKSLISMFVIQIYLSTGRKEAGRGWVRRTRAEKREIEWFDSSQDSITFDLIIIIIGPNISQRKFSAERRATEDTYR